MAWGSLGVSLELSDRMFGHSAPLPTPTMSGEAISHTYSYAETYICLSAKCSLMQVQPFYLLKHLILGLIDLHLRS